MRAAAKMAGVHRDDAVENVEHVEPLPTESTVSDDGIYMKVRIYLGQTYVGEYMEGNTPEVHELVNFAKKNTWEGDDSIPKKNKQTRYQNDRNMVKLAWWFHLFVPMIPMIQCFFFEDNPTGSSHTKHNTV